MTRRGLLKKVVEHCNKQGAQSIVNAACKYRHGKLRCAIGALMPNKVYRRKMEGLGVYQLSDAVLVACGFNLNREGERTFAEELQGLHDNISNWSRVSPSSDKLKLRKEAIDRVKSLFLINF